MHLLFVSLHVAAMVISLLLISTALIMGYFAKESSIRVARYSLLGAIVGTVTGGVLLFDSLLSVGCMALTFYLFAVATLYVVGFGRGNITAAKLVRVPVKKD